MHHNLAEPSNSNQTTTPSTSTTATETSPPIAGIRYTGTSNPRPSRLPPPNFGDFATDIERQASDPNSTRRTPPGTPFDTPRPPAIRTINEPSDAAGRLYRTLTPDGEYPET